MKLTLLQTAVRSINDLRIVETLDEFQSTTYGRGSSTSLSYDTYYDLLINACVRYDKTKKTNIGKTRNVYATNIDETYVDHPTACIDHVPNSPYGGIVGSHQVSFPMCTLETLQKYCSTSSLLLTFC